MRTYNAYTGYVVCADPGVFNLVRGQVYRVTDAYKECGEGWVTIDDLGGFRARRFRPATPAEIDAAFPPELPFAAPSAGNDPAPREPEVSSIDTLAETVAPPAGLPDGNPKTRFGVAKPPIALIPGPALIHMADAFRDGAKKYGPANWRIDPVTTSTYVNAALRHILAYYDGETNAPDSGVHHLGHAAGCLAILLDAEAQGTLNDDRPTPGRTSELIAEKTTPLS
jgi:hypothetical protein